MLLTDCGHTFCACCIQEASQKEGDTFTCPIDGIYYEKPSQFKTNKFIYLQLENTYSNCSKCFLHQLPKKQKCLTCMIDICDECKLTKMHDKHLFEQKNGRSHDNGGSNKNKVTLLLADLKTAKISMESRLGENNQII